MAEPQGAGSPDTGADRPDGVSVRFRTGTAAPLSAPFTQRSAFELDLERGTAAELEVGVETAPGWAQIWLPQPARRSLTPGPGLWEGCMGRLGSVSCLEPLGLSSLLPEPLPAPTTQRAWWGRSARTCAPRSARVAGWGLVSHCVCLPGSCAQQRETALTLRALTSSLGLLLAFTSRDPSPLLSHPPCVVGAKGHQVSDPTRVQGPWCWSASLGRDSEPRRKLEGEHLFRKSQRWK